MAEKDPPDAPTQPARRAVRRRASSPDVADAPTTPGRRAVARRGPAALEPALADPLDAFGDAPELLASPLRLADSRGRKRYGWRVEGEGRELCRFVLQTGFLASMVDSFQEQLDDSFEWLSDDGPLGTLTLSWTEGSLLDLEERPLYTLELGPLVPPAADGTAHARVCDDEGQPVVVLRRPDDARGTQVQVDGRPWGWLSHHRSHDELGLPTTGLRFEPGAALPPGRRFLVLLGALSLEYATAEWQRRRHHYGGI